MTVEHLWGHRVLFVHHEQPLVITLTDPILHDDEPDSWGVTVDMARARDMVTLTIPSGLKEKQRLGPYTISLRKFSVMLTLVVVGDKANATRSLKVKHKPLLEVMRAAAREVSREEREKEQKRVAALLATQKTEYEAQLKEVRRQARKANKISSEAMLLTELPSAYKGTRRVRGARACRGTDVVICRQQWTPLRNYGVLRFMVKNRTKRLLETSYVQVHNEQGARDHAGLVRFGDGEPIPSDAATLRLAPGHSMSVAVSVRDPKNVGKSVELALGIVGRSLPKFQTIDLDPEPPEGEGLITLSLQGIAGAVWLANPVDTAELGATSTAGLSLRIRRGINQLISFEGEIAGTRSGSASWDGMMFENEEGEIVRNATLGRVLLGGVLHFGDRYRPMFRAGVGFQGVKHGSRFMPATGVEREGPESGFEAAGLWWFGLGFEARLGEHWTAGLDAKFVGVATSTNAAGLKTALEGGLHLSYGWTPGY